MSLRKKERKRIQGIIGSRDNCERVVERKIEWRNNGNEGERGVKRRTAMVKKQRVKKK